MARHTGDLRVIEGFDTDLIVGAYESEGGRDTPDLFSARLPYNEHRDAY
ncbi:MAG: hypothetical protein ACREXX_14905 [Gammaproteobacteria bacterium]